MTGPRVLVVDDDRELCDLLREYLGQEGFEVEMVHDGASGLERASAGTYALVVLDVMLPEMNGFDVLRELRARSAVPVLMLTARGQDVDRIVGLEMGADDYLGKPFNPRELLARIRAISRRVSRPSIDETITVDDVTLDPAAHQATRGGEVLALTTAELALLEALLRDAGRAVDREALSEPVLGRRFNPMDRSIDVHVSNLRKKLGPAPGGGERIKTVRGHGYLYAVSRESAPG